MFRSLVKAFSLLISLGCVASAQNAPLVLKNPNVVSVGRGGGVATIDLQNAFGLADSRGPIVRFDTSVGGIDLELFPEVTPLTVANFRNYISSGRYKDTFIHRSIPGFVIQGGGYKIAENLPHIPTFAAVKNEFQRSNLQGTIAMAKLGDNPNSATSEWFFNLQDNSENLDNQNAGFAVFGKVLGKGLVRAQSIAALPAFNLGGALTDCPIINYKSGQQLTTDNLVAVKSVSEIPLLPTSNATASYLTLSVVSSNPSLLKASMNGTQLRLQSVGSGVGEVLVTITATDPDQQKTSLPLTIPVVNGSAPLVSITAPDAMASESLGDAALLRISRSGSTASPLLVSLLSNGTAVNRVDVQSIPAAVTIPAGKSSCDVSIIPIADGKAEGRENLVFKIPPTLTQRPGKASTTIDILDKEVPVLSWSPIASSTTEGGDPAKIRLARTGSMATALTVPLSLSGANPARLGLGNLTSATIPAGSASTEIRFSVPNNADLTGTQSLSVAIGSTALANTPANPVEILVHDNDVPTISLEAVDGTASEPAKDKASVRVRRTGATAAPLTIYLSISGSALAGVDYFSLPASVTIPAGGDSAFLDLVAKDDSLKEGQETVSLAVDRSIYYNTPAGSLRLVINDND
jgi:cyclophilin family peptidyl-prolyl cis-trans isomerase